MDMKSQGPNDNVNHVTFQRLSKAFNTSFPIFISIFSPGSQAEK